MRRCLSFYTCLCLTFLFSGSQDSSNSIFRVLPYLQVYEDGRFQLSWITNDAGSSTVELYDDQGNLVVSQTLTPALMPEVFYTSLEKAETISGLSPGEWLQADQAYKSVVQFPVLKPGEVYTYIVRKSGMSYSSSFRSVPSKDNWESIRFIALSDSETEPQGRVVRRGWYPANFDFRPSAVSSAWKDAFGITVDNGFPILNYPLTEEKGYQENLKIINNRQPQFLLMPGDLVQGGGYQPAWDEFFRQNAGDLGKGLSAYPILPALGNWENAGGKNGGYGFSAKGDFLPKLGRSRFHAYFETPTQDPLQKHRQSYYRVDYGPITILTLDSSNGTPEAKRSDTPAAQKLKNKEYSGPGTDTQENFTQAEYEANGGNDLSGFGPGSDQYRWLEENLTEAKEAGQLIFVQFHHIPYSSGEHGVPMNHELSTGQGGTPLRVLQPLFEEAGVIAVFAGHDELFERSFVDEDQDGKGVLYYDVGVAGDGLRGEKRNYLSDPTQLLNYNDFKQWTADQNSPEQWDRSGPNPILSDGGKHYGHLEVNLQRVSVGKDTFAKIKFSPVYAFPVLDQNYTLQRVERRVYADEVELMVLLQSSDFVPEFRDSVALFLTEAQALGTSPESFGSTVELKPEDFLVKLPEEEFEYNSAKGFVFDCEDLGEQEFQISATNVRTGKVWVSDLKLVVLDSLAPRFRMSAATKVFDPLLGALELDIADFSPVIEFDNCSSGYDYELSRTQISCTDVDWRNPEQILDISAVATDASGNRSEASQTTATIRFVPSDTISLSALGSLYEGNSQEIRLGSEFGYEVLAWYKNEELIEGEKGNSIRIDTPGTYFAEIELESGCIVASARLTVEMEQVPFPPLREEVILDLDEQGKATLEAADLFVSWPPETEDFTVSLSQSEFTCASIGLQDIELSLSNQAGDSWILQTQILIRDTIPPQLLPKNIEIQVDRVIGVKEISVEDLLVSATDNCELKELRLSRQVFGCEDIGTEVAVSLRAEDLYGNIQESLALVKVSGTVSKPLTISGDQAFCFGESGTLTLDAETGFEVIRWRRNGEAIEGEVGKSLEVSESGVYSALIRFEGACLWESANFEVRTFDLPSGEIAEDGNILRAPEGDFSYRWFRDSEEIPGATERTLVVDQMGTYSVELTNGQGCTKILNGVTLTISAINSRPPLQAKSLRLYPNPGATWVQARIDADPGFVLEGIKVYAQEGREVSSAVGVRQKAANLFELDIQLLPQGVYLVWFYGAEQKLYFGKLVKK
ncbi:metallophosphoesterase [Algoriphagus namhaensis]